MQRGSWDQRRFLNIDLAAQEAGTIEQRFIRYLSQEKVISGEAVSDAENMVRARQRPAAAYDSIAKTWSQIVGTPDDILVDLVSETAERICGIKPESALIRQFLLQRARSQETQRERRTLQPPGRTAKPAQRHETGEAERRAPLPTTLDPSDPNLSKTALLRSKEAWIAESHRDGRKEFRHWRAQYMTL